MLMILVGDLAQLPPIMDKMVYASHSNAKKLWHNFNKVVTMETIFRQQDEDPLQIQFFQALQNICNVDPMLHDWEFLMTRTKNNLTPN